MKKILFILIAAFSFAGIFNSCEALPFNYSSSQSWLISENSPEKTWTSLSILQVKVERTSGWDFVEKEAASLAPLYFWNQGCKVVDAGQKPSYTAAIQLREREFNFGWRTKRSLAMEVRIWPYEEASYDKNTAEGVLLLYEKKLPVAVGRITVLGEKSFSSSGTTGNLLSKAIKKAAKELSAYERKKDA